ncbi:hypothetical protein [Arthrobacter rhizosphaerae]|uniref:hypothetical protein n=1 Tax=Arthrobacter rhizosphaerae TaxID=2855490 RepID=UPI001FF3E9AD|nr:hypothetical protein [Arthrobacter rhizosphaerae]
MNKKLMIYLHSQKSFRAVVDDLEIEVRVGPPPPGSVSGPGVTILDADNPGDSPDLNVAEAGWQDYSNPEAILDVADVELILHREGIWAGMATEVREPPKWEYPNSHVNAEGSEPPPWTVIMPHVVDSEDKEPLWTTIQPHAKAQEAFGTGEGKDWEGRNGR